MLETARHLDQARNAAGELTQGHEKLGELADRQKGNSALKAHFEGVSEFAEETRGVRRRRIQHRQDQGLDGRGDRRRRPGLGPDGEDRLFRLAGAIARRRRELAGASGLIGGLSTLQTNLQAITDGTDETSAALKALGLTAAQLKGQLPTTQLEIIAKCSEQFGDGATKTTALTKLLGSAAEGLIRTLDQGASGVKALEDATASAGAVLDAGLVQALARTHQHILELNQAWTSGAGVIVGVVNPAIDRVIVKLTAVLDSITADKIRAGWSRSAKR